MTFDGNEVLQLVNAFKESLDKVNAELADLKKSLYDDFLTPAEENFKSWDHSVRLGEFKDKYKDTLTDELCSKCREAEGDESFDLADKIFSDYDAMEDKMPEDEYVATVVASLTEQLNKLKETLNAETVEVVADEGEVKVEADGEVVAEATELKEEPETDEPETDELDDFIKELEKEADGAKAHSWY